MLVIALLTAVGLAVIEMQARMLRQSIRALQEALDVPAVDCSEPTRLPNDPHMLEGWH